MASKLGNLTAINTYTSKIQLANTMRAFSVQITGTIAAGGVVPQITLVPDPDEATDTDWVSLTAMTALGLQTNTNPAMWVRAKANGTFNGDVNVWVHETVSGRI